MVAHWAIHRVSEFFFCILAQSVLFSSIKISTAHCHPKILRMVLSCSNQGKFKISKHYWRWPLNLFHLFCSRREGGREAGNIGRNVHCTVIGVCFYVLRVLELKWVENRFHQNFYFAKNLNNGKLFCMCCQIAKTSKALFCIVLNNIYEHFAKFREHETFCHYLERVGGVEEGRRGEEGGGRRGEGKSKRSALWFELWPGLHFLPTHSYCHFFI